MISRSDRLRAAELALGNLDDATVARLRARMTTDPEFRAEVDRREAQIAGHLSGVDLGSPPPAVFAQIEAVLDRGLGLPGAVTVRHTEGVWRELLPGVSTKVLHRDLVAGRQSYLVKMKPGAVLPAHFHGELEECLVLEGALVMNGLRIEKGDFQMVPAGVAHPVMYAPEGALFYIRGELSLRPA